MRSAFRISAIALSLNAVGSGLALASRDPARDGDVRKEAAILAAEDRRCFAPDLFLYLNDADPLIRERSALAAGRIGDARAIDPLAALLADESASVRSMAAFALGEIEDSTAADPLAWRLRSGAERESTVRAAMLEAIGKLGAKRQAPLAVAAMEDASAEVRVAGCLAAWRLGSPSAVPSLLALTRDADSTVRYASVYALVRMIGTPASGRTPVPGAIALPDGLVEPARAALMGAAGSADAETRLIAARGLGRFRNDAVDTALLGALEDRDWRVRVEAARALAAAATPAAQPTATDVAGTLTRLLSDPSPNARIVALEGLGAAGDREAALVSLRAFLARNDIHPREREVASLSIAARLREDAPDSVAARAERVTLARSLSIAPQWTLRAAAVAVLDGIDDADAVSLRERLASDEPRIAKEALAPRLRDLVTACAAGTPLLDCVRGVLDRSLTAPDPVLRSITLDALASMREDVRHPLPDDAWIALLTDAWKRAAGDRENDVRLTITGLLEPVARDGRARAILDDAAAAPDLPLRRAALAVIARADSVAPGPVPPLDRPRTEEDYADIVTWAREPHAVTIETEHGTATVELHADRAPLTCWNFVHLAESGFFDNGRWHRIVPDFVVQDGCPRGDGYGGPGYQIRCEINTLRYETGAVGMALSGKDTGGSQFFVTQSPQPHLDGRYTVFGKVIAGGDVLDRLIQGDAIVSIRERN